MKADEPRQNRIPFMLSDTELKAVDDWRFANRVATRAEAIRRLCQIGLSFDSVKAAEGLRLMAGASAELGIPLLALEDLLSGASTAAEIKQSVTNPVLDPVARIKDAMSETFHASLIFRDQVRAFNESLKDPALDEALLELNEQRPSGGSEK